jgi:uncharacterized protein YhaN
MGAQTWTQRLDPELPIWFKLASTMLIESVHARAFGPLVDRRLDLAPGMNVIWGPNEAGKSTWHAAICAGLCGMRRSRGKTTSDDQRFAERHRPWDGDRWEVGSTIRLADERRIELRHDLAGRVDSRASDADLGRDCSHEIIMDGAPDGSRWLGLDRRSFATIASVRQANLLSILEKPEMLQDELQRAAATGGTDATAAAALALLAQFRAEHVGRNIAASIRPLRRAHQALDAARLALDTARAEHSRFVELAVKVEQHKAEVARLSEAIRVAQVQRERAELDALRHRHAAALELAEDFPGGPPVADPAQHQLVQDVATALEAWRQQPEEPVLTGPAFKELRAQLEVLDREPVSATRRPRERAGRVPIAVGALMLIVSIGLGVAGQLVLATLLVIAGLGTLLFWTSRRSRVAAVEFAPGSAVEDLREALRREIERREQDELRIDSIRAQRQKCSDVILEMAKRCGINQPDEEARVANLERWLGATQRQVEELARQAHRYANLAQEKGNPTVEELEAEIEARQRTLRLSGDLPEDMPADDSMAELETRLDDAKRSLANLQGQRQQLEQSLPGVAEAEERYAAAEAELARVRRLDAVLEATQRFLGDAQERVHRDIAPVLAAAIRSRLGPITNGRYTDARVDPASLEVRVLDADGQWREAALLSHGTAEQIYLLLRVALTEHLSKPGEICPLILDEITAHSDDERTQAVLETLHCISRERQVILFSQETQVREWAEANLAAERDCLTMLHRALECGE